MISQQLNFRSLLLVKGQGSKQFLQGLITKDIGSLTDTSRLIYTFLLNVKGRIFVDFFVWGLGDEAFALETDSDRMLSLQKLLNTYKLRRQLKIEPLPTYKVCFSNSKTSQQDSSSFPCSSSSIQWLEDPRVPGFGFRSLQIIEEEFLQKMDEEGKKKRLDYLEHRTLWGIGEGAEIYEQIPFNINGDLLNALSFEKGCYIGQELVSRTYHSGIVRRRLMPFKWVGNNSRDGGVEKSINKSTDDLILRDGKGARQGKLVSSCGERGLCIVSVDAVPENTSTLMFDKNGRELEVQRPEWWPKSKRD